MRWLWALLAVAATPAWALTEVTETLASGANIRVAVPDGWHAGDDLLLYQHGFSMDADADPDLGPLRDLQLAQGYAIAASGYSQSGWALFNAVDDNRDLIAYVTTHFGAPGRLITMGGSMGGLISLKLAESPGFEATAGVYSLCAPAAGARTWDSAFDLRLAYDAVCDGVGGGELLVGDEPLSWAYNLSDIPASMGDLSGARSVQQTLVRIHQCTGVALEEWMRSSAQRERMQRLMQFGAFTSEDFLLYNLAYATFALGDLVRADDKLGGRNPFSSRGVFYGDALIDASVPRITADPLAQFDFARATTLNGRLPAATRVVAVHTSGDELVRLAHQQQVRSLYGARAVSVPVDEAVGSHCGFSAAEIVAGWEQLRAWIALPGAAADANALGARCTVALGGGHAGPCRFAPALDVGQINTTMRDRDATATAHADAASAAISGTWYDPARSGEGVLIERLDARRATVVWFTYAPHEAATTPSLVWIGGVGEIDTNGIHVSDVRRMYGAQFGAEFDPADVVRAPWGSLDLAFDGHDLVNGAARMHLRYAGPPNYGSGVLQMRRLQAIGPATPIVGNPGAARAWQYSGTWYDPTRSGEGWLIQQSGAPNPQLTSLAWFTYDLDGKAMWLTGAGFEHDGEISVTLYRTNGTWFGPAFDASAVTRTPFGTATLRFDDCDHAELAFVAIDPQYGTLSHPLRRLTKPDVVAATCVAD